MPMHRRDEQAAVARARVASGQAIHISGTRVANIVANMKGANTEAALKRLVGEGVITNQHREAWS